MKFRRKSQAGFTLVEMLVAVGLFAVVMLISVSALLSLVGANRKAQGLQSVMNNLNIALDEMVRTIRMGSVYYCSSNGNGYPLPLTPSDCSGTGGVFLIFEPYGWQSGQPYTEYSYEHDSQGIGRIYKTYIGGPNSHIAITAPEVSIDYMQFYVTGTTPHDTTQPKVVIVIKGTAGASQLKTSTTFSIQATAVARLLDL